MSTNISAATATLIATWGSTVQDVSDTAGPNYEVWFQYVAKTSERALGVWSQAPVASNYDPRIDVYTGTAASLTSVMTSLNQPIIVGTVPGQTYFFKVTQVGSGAPSASLTLILTKAGSGAVEAGSLLVNDTSVDGTGQAWPTAVVSPSTGAIVGYVPLPAGEAGIALPNGIIAIEDREASDVKLFSSAFAQIASVPVDMGGNGQINSNWSNTFYIGRPNGVANASVTAVSQDGTIIRTWTLGQVGLRGLSLSTNEAILYYVASGTGSNQPVRRWDMVNDVALSDLAPLIAGTTIRRDIVTMPDGSVLVAYRPASGAYYVNRYDPSGSVLSTYTFSDPSVQSVQRVFRDFTEGLFWVWEENAAETEHIFSKVRASDGATVLSFRVPLFVDGESQGDFSDTRTDLFGASWSCPVMGFPLAFTIPTPTTTRTPPTVTPPTNCPCPPRDGGPTPGGGGGGGGTSGGGLPPPSGTGEIGGGGFGKSGENEGGTGWTPNALCQGGGTVKNDYPPVPAMESMADVRDPRVWAAIAFKEFSPDNTETAATEYWALDQTMPDPPDAYGGKKPGRGLSVSRITRGMSDDAGNYVAPTVTLRIDDKDRDALRTRLGDTDAKYVWEREGIMFIASEANRRSQYADLPRELFRGVTHDVALGRQFTASITFEDKIGSQFGAFGPDRAFPSRLLTNKILPGIPREIDGQPQQWIFGEVSDEGATTSDGTPASKGLVPLWLVGSLGSEDEYHLAAHAIGGMTLYGSDGGDPPTRVLLSDYRYETLELTDSESGEVHTVTHVFLPTGSVASEAHKNGELTMAANVCGVLGLDGITITNLFWAYQYIFEHIVLPDHESLTGEYVGSPEWADGRVVIHSQSFQDAQSYSALRIAARGYQCGFVLGGPANGQVDLRELLARMSNSGDCWFTWTAQGQLKVVLLDDALDPSDTPILREPARLREMPSPMFAFEEVENPVLFSYDWDDDKQKFRVAQEAVKDQTAIDRMGRPKPSDAPIAMRCTRDPITARDVAQRQLLRRKYPPGYYEVVEPLDGLDRDPGDTIRITSQEGVGDGSTERAMWIRETSYDHGNRRVTQFCRDLTDILESAALWSPETVTDWDSATEAERTAYAFWSDDDGLVNATTAGKGFR